MRPLERCVLGCLVVWAVIPAAASNLDFATLVGGKNSLSEFVADVAVDDAGFVYIVGATDVRDLPMVDPIQAAPAGSADAFLMKLSSEGEIVFSTYLGGSRADSATSVAVADNGDIFVAGMTDSADFPIVKGKQKKNAGPSDAWVARIAKDGSKVLASTYLGGSGHEMRIGLELGRSGPVSKGVYVWGSTDSTDFPRKGATQSQFAGGFSDVFLTVMKSKNLKPVFSTYAGEENNEEPAGFALNEERGDLYLGLFDSGHSERAAIVHYQLEGAARLSAAAGKPASKYGEERKVLRQLTGTIPWTAKFFVLGAYFQRDELRQSTASTALGPAIATIPCAPVPPATSCSQPGGLLLLDEDLALLSNRGFGGTPGGAFAPTAIATGADGSIAVVGDTISDQIQLVDPIQNKRQGNWDSFIYLFPPDAQTPSFGTYYGGTAGDFADSVAIGPDGRVWVAGVTFSKRKLTTTPDAQHRRLLGSHDGYLLAIDAD